MEEKTLTLTRGVPVLPWELVIEILSWLPVKTLLRFRCVSKSWKSLISDDKSFTKLHLNRSLQNEHFLLKLELTNFIEDGVFPIPVSRLLNGPPSIDDDWFSRVRYNYSQIDDGCDRRFRSMYSDYCSRLKSDYSILKSDYSILGSYNGLVCLLGWYEFSYPTEQVWIRLWNPATRSMSRKSPICAVPYDSWKYYGFGYDHSRHAYKVVMVLWDCHEKKMETIVYCMGDACWRKVSSNHGFPLRLKAFEGQFVDGCMNWLALDKLNSHSHSWRDANVTLDHLVIVSFDMRQEAYRFLSLPEGVSHEVPHDHSNLGVLRNCLCLFHDHNKTHFVVWQMREYGVHESWTQLATISYTHLRCDGFPLYSPLMCFCEDRDIVLFLNKTWSGSNEYQGLEVVMYNLRDNSGKCVIQLRNNKLSLCGNDYVQSLVSPCQDYALRANLFC